MDVSVPQVVELLFVVAKISSQDRTLQRIVEQNSCCCGDVDRGTVGGCANIVIQDRIQQRSLMQISDVPFPQEEEELVDVFTDLSHDRDQQCLRSSTSKVPLLHPLRSSFSPRTEQHRVQQVIETADISLIEEIKEVTKFERERSSRS